MGTPVVPLLVWVFGFGPGDVYAVGVGGGVIHYDGVQWTRLDPGTDEDLWGVWGKAPNDIWIVGGNVGQGEPVILHFDGREWKKAHIGAEPVTVRTIARLGRAVVTPRVGPLWGSGPEDVWVRKDVVRHVKPNLERPREVS